MCLGAHPLPFIPAQDAVLVLLERVSEAQRIAAMQMKEADKKKGGKRRGGGHAADDEEGDPLRGGGTRKRGKH